MVDIGITLQHGLLICVPFTIFVAVSFLANPRLWLHSLPPDVQQMAAPKTRKEIVITKFVLLPLFILILPGLSTLSTVYTAMTIPTLTVPGAVHHLYLLWIIVHLWDLIVIDGIAMLLINPDNPPIAGTENAAGWRDYRFHMRSFGKAALYSAVFVVPVGAVIAYIL